MTRPTLTTGSILRGLGHLSVPMLVTGLLQNVQSLIDLFWVGSLGPSAVAAVAMSGAVLMTLFPLVMGISTGTIAIVARAAGAGRLEEAEEAASQSMLLSLVFGVVSGIAGILLSGFLLDLLGAGADIAEAGTAYLRISLLGSATVFVLFIGNAALQGVGDALTPMWIMLVANVLNIFLDPAFIFGLGPLPRMGVRGAALATVLAQGAAAFLSVFFLLNGKTHLHLKLHHFKPALFLCWRILRIGIPGAGQMLARSLVNAVMMRFVAAAGTIAVAAYGVGMRFHMIVLMPAFALGGAAATMVGQNLGAGEPRRAKRSAWYATLIDVAIMCVAAAAFMVFAPDMIGAFNSDPDVVAVGTNYLRIVSPFYVFAALGIILGRALNGAGDSMTPFIITMLSLWGLQVPLAVAFSRLWQPAIHGIWWSMAAAMAVHGILVASWFETGRWMKKHV
ncbi:MAG: MATE family efflux transporter [Planctomycetota bacterium]